MGRTASEKGKGHSEKHLAKVKSPVIKKKDHSKKHHSEVNPTIAKSLSVLAAKEENGVYEYEQYDPGAIYSGICSLCMDFPETYCSRLANIFCRRIR